MKLHQLRALVAVQEHGSMQEASKILHVTQPALSRAIKELEHELGTQLLVRNSRGVVLTESGQRLLVHARHVNESLRRARQDLDDMKARSAPQVTLGVTSAVSLLVPVQQALAEYIARQPEVKLRILELRPPQILPLLREGSMDLALISQLLPQSSALQWNQLCRMPMQIVANRGNPLRNARSLRELVDAQWITSDALENPLSPLSQLFQQNGLPLPAHHVECNSTVLFSRMMTETPVLSLVATTAFDDQIPVFGLNIQKVQIHERIPDMRISLVYDDEELMTRPAHQLFRLLQEHFWRAYPRSE